MDNDRYALRKEIITRIEKAFPGSIVVWLGTGCPDDNFQDDTERFEAYMIPREDTRRFEDFVWQLYLELGKPNGFAIMVHDLDPETTEKYRQDEYLTEKILRKALTVVEVEETTAWNETTKVVQRALGISVTVGNTIAIGLMRESPWEPDFTDPCELSFVNQPEIQEIEA